MSVIDPQAQGLSWLCFLLQVLGPLHISAFLQAIFKWQQKYTLAFEGGNYSVKLPKMKSQKEQFFNLCLHWKDESLMFTSNIQAEGRWWSTQVPELRARDSVLFIGLDVFWLPGYQWQHLKIFPEWRNTSVWVDPLLEVLVHAYCHNGSSK